MTRFCLGHYLVFSGLLISCSPAALLAQQPNRVSIDLPAIDTSEDILKDCAFHRTPDQQLLLNCTIVRNYEKIISNYETTPQRLQIWSALLDDAGNFLHQQVINFDKDVYDATLLAAFSPTRWLLVRQAKINLGDELLPGQPPDQTSFFFLSQIHIGWQQLIWQLPNQPIIWEEPQSDVFPQASFIDPHGYAITVSTDIPNSDTSPESNTFSLQAQDQSGKMIWKNHFDVERLLVSSNPDSFADGFNHDSGDIFNKFILPCPQGGFIVYGPGKVPKKFNPSVTYGLFILCFSADGSYQNSAFIPKLYPNQKYVSVMPDGRLALFPFYDQKNGGDGSQLAYLDADCHQESYQTIAPIHFPDHFKTNPSSPLNHFMAAVTGANKHHYLLYRQYEWEDKDEWEGQTEKWIYRAKDQHPALYVLEIDENGGFIHDYPVIRPQELDNSNLYADRPDKEILADNYDMTLSNDQKFLLISINQISLHIDENNQENPPLLLYRLPISK